MSQLVEQPQTGLSGLVQIKADVVGQVALVELGRAAVFSAVRCGDG